MRDRVRNWLLKLLRVPAEPAPPPGDPRFLQAFRAAPSYFHYSVATWALKQASAFAVALTTYIIFRAAIETSDLSRFYYFGIFEQLALVMFIVQLPLSYALVRLNFEMRWYILSDRSLRIRHGILSVHEQTMTFANIQNISIRQNPLQRIFGIASVVVRAAGGGSGTNKQGQQDSHEATFEGVANGDQIRDVIRNRVRRHRDSGLGDPDEAVASAARTLVHAGDADDGVLRAAAPQSASLRPALAAAHRVLAEARRLREPGTAGS